MPHLRLGILGAARIAERNMLPAIAATPDVELVAIASRDLDRAARLAATFGGEARSNYQAVIGDPEIDAVYVPLPIGLHRMWAGAALEAGKHVLCEKSLAGNYAHARELVELARQKSRVLVENFMCETHPQNLRARDAVRSGELGAVGHLALSFGFPAFPPDDQRNSRELEGGALNDAGAYCVDMAQFYLDAVPEAVFASGHWNGADVDQRGSATLVFPGGVEAHLAYGFGLDYRNEVRIWGATGQLTIDRSFSIPADREPTITITRNTVVERVAVAAADQFQSQLARFRDGALAGELPGEHDRVLRHAQVMEAVRRSAREGRRVEIAEIVALSSPTVSGSAAE